MCSHANVQTIFVERNARLRLHLFVYDPQFELLFDSVRRATFGRINRARRYRGTRHRTKNDILKFYRTLVEAERLQSWPLSDKRHTLRASLRRVVNFSSLVTRIERLTDEGTAQLGMNGPMRCSYKLLPELYYRKSRACLRREYWFRPFKNPANLTNISLPYYKTLNYLPLRSLCFENSRAPLYLYFANEIRRGLRKILGCHGQVRFTPLETHRATTKLLAIWVLRRLYFRHSLGAIFYPLIRMLGGFVKGFRARCSGRFTRRQRSSFRTFRIGKLPLNSFGEPIDYIQASIPLKYGVGSVKIWILHKQHELQVPGYFGAVEAARTEGLLRRTAFASVTQVGGPMIYRLPRTKEKLV